MILIIILLALYNGLFVFILYMEHDPFFIKALLLYMTSIGVWYFQKKGLFRSFKFFVPLVMVFTISLSLFFTQKIYLMETKIYLDNTVVISMNDNQIDKEDSKRLKELLLDLEEYTTTVSSAEPTYTLSYSGLDDPDTLHIQIFKEDNFVLHGCLLGIEKGDTLEGYRLTNEVLDILERQENENN